MSANGSVPMLQAAILAPFFLLPFSFGAKQTVVIMSLAELPANQKNDMIVSLAALLLEDAGENRLVHLMSRRRIPHAESYTCVPPTVFCSSKLLKYRRGTHTTAVQLYWCARVQRFPCLSRYCCSRLPSVEYKYS